MAEGQKLSVISTSPGRFGTAIPIDSVISVIFNLDLDPSSVNISTVIVAEDVVSPIAGTVEYDILTKTITFIPENNLTPNKTYQVTLVGQSDLGGDPGLVIKDILGRPLLGNYVFTFTTSSAQRPLIPNLISPIDQSQLDITPAFSWSSISGSDHYEIQVSSSNLFAPVSWPTIDNPVFATSVTPDINLVDGHYYWRVRAVSSDGIVGDWSEVWRFRKGIVFEDIIPEPEETLPPRLGFGVIPSGISFYVTSVTPPNLSIVPTGLTDVLVGFSDIPDISSLDFSLISYPVDRDPFLVESIIPASGINYPFPSGNSIDFILPSGSLLENQELILTIKDLESVNNIPISEDLIFNLFTTFNPLFVSPFTIRTDLGNLVAKKTDLDIKKIIYIIGKDALKKASAEILSAYESGTIDNSLVCYTRYATDIVIINAALASLSLGDVSEQLGDYSIRVDSSNLARNLKLLLDDLGGKLRQCEEYLTGLNFNQVRVPLSARRGGTVEPTFDSVTNRDDISDINVR